MSGGRGIARYAFIAPHVVLLLMFGIIPAAYALYLALTNRLGQFTGIGQFVKVFQDYRFPTAFGHVAWYSVIWLVSLTVLTVLFALLIHQQHPRVSGALRFVFYIPGALAGVASVLVWVFMLDPSASPVGGLLQALGFSNIQEVTFEENLPVIFVLIAFWTGAGGWILVMYGALNNIPAELIEAAKIDGAGRLNIAWRIQIPLIRKWIVYMVVLAFGAGIQLFVEPGLVGAATRGGVDPTWSPNQLAYQYAFQQNDFNGAAAIAVCILILGIAGALIVVFRTGLFKTEAEEA
jgi:multiple sugar transport system permease protein